MIRAAETDVRPIAHAIVRLKKRLLEQSQQIAKEKQS